MKAVLACFSVAALIGIPVFGAAKVEAPPVHRWLLSQRVNACFPWYLWALQLSTSSPPNGLTGAREATSYRVDDPNVDRLLVGATQEERHKPGSDMLSSVSVVYDAKSQIVLFHQLGYEESDIVLTAEASAPPLRVTQASLGSYHSKLGVRLGLRMANVAKIFGKPAKLVHACGMTALGYAVSKPPPAPTGCFFDYQFVFKNDKLVAISYSESC